MQENSFTFNQKPNRPDLWIIESIKHPDGTDRTDGHNPARIGRTAVILFVGVCKPLIWSYVADSDGGVRDGARVSGRINDVYYDPETETLYAESKNSRYRLKKLPQKWGEIYADRCIGLPDWYPDCLGAIPITIPCKAGQ